MSRVRNARAITHGSVVRDLTTGQYLVVMSRPTSLTSSSELRVRPLYRDDEFTVSVTAVEPSRDPHTWRRSDYIKSFSLAPIVLFIMIGWSTMLHRYDVPLYFTVTASVSVAAWSNYWLVRLFKIHRN